MEQEQEKVKVKTVATWFWRWFLNNKVVTILLVSLLILLNILVFSKITYVFDPLKGFIEVIGLPLLMAGILYYLVNPLVDWIEMKKVPRVGGSDFCFVFFFRYNICRDNIC